VQSFLGLGFAGLTILFYCLRFKNPPIWMASSPYLDLPGSGWPSYTPRHYVPFLSPPTTHKAMVEIFNFACTQDSTSNSTTSPHFVAPTQTTQKMSLPLLHILSLENSVSTELFPSNSCYLAMGLISHFSLLKAACPE
jgi:hypothetical protein